MLSENVKQAESGSLDIVYGALTAMAMLAVILFIAAELLQPTV